MKTKVFFVAAAVFALILTGCGGGGTVVTTVITDIPSNGAADAYVAENLNTSTLSAPVAGSGAIRVGIDPTLTLPLGTEYRGLIDFPLRGVGGIPLGATIVSATLDVVVSSRQFFSPVPIRIDMIDAPPPFFSSDYDEVAQPPILTLPPATSGFSVIGTGTYLVDVTAMVQEAQMAPALSGLQLRLMLPLTPGASGLVTIDDFDLFPILTVEYF